MRTVFKCLAIVIGLLIVIFLDAIWWGTHPDTAVNFSSPVWRGLIWIYGAKTGPQETDLAFLVSSAVIMLGGVGVWACWRWRSKDGAKKTDA